MLTFISECTENIALDKLNSFFKNLLIEQVLGGYVLIVKRVNQINHALLLLFFEFCVLLGITEIGLLVTGSHFCDIKGLDLLRFHI